MKIVVKSNPEFFEKEKDGRKPNTIRKLDGRDTVLIQNSKDPEDFFIRTITDLSTHEGWLIISFKPEPIQELTEELKKKFPESEVKIEEQPTKITVNLKEKKPRGKRGSYKKKPLPELLKCPRCKSEDIIRRGFRLYKGKRTQKYGCKKCNKMFSDSPSKRGRPSLKDEYFEEAKELYKTLSLTKVVEKLKERHGLDFNISTTHNWLKDAGLIKEKTPSPKPKPKEEQKEGLMAQSFKHFKRGLSDEEIAGLMKVKESMIKTFRGYWKRRKRTTSPKVILKQSTLEKDGVEVVEEKDWEDEDDSFGDG